MVSSLDMLRPADVVALHDRILETVRDEEWGLRLILRVHRGQLHFPFTGAGPHRRMWTIDRYLRELEAMLKRATLYYVSPEMSQVVEAAGRGLPEYNLHRDMLPAETGFVVWGGPAAIGTPGPRSDLGPGERLVTRAALWSTVDDTGADPPEGILLATWQDAAVMAASRGYTPEETDVLLHRLAGPLAYHDEIALPFGRLASGANPTRIANATIAAALSTWVLMGQRITEITDEAPTRAARRQAERAGRAAPPLVRAVTMRPTKRTARPTPAPDDGQAPGRRYDSHRWIVQGYGYWRNTWYPSLEDHRLQFVYVPEYVKGPDGAPLLTRVNVLR